MHFSPDLESLVVRHVEPGLRPKAYGDRKLLQSGKSSQSQPGISNGPRKYWESGPKTSVSRIAEFPGPCSVGLTGSRRVLPSLALSRNGNDRPAAELEYENHSGVTSFTSHEVILCCCGITGHFLESALYDVVVEPGACHLFEENPFRLLGGRRENCSICRQPMQKKNPTEAIPCSCGKYVWTG